jgi:hypothetical protein
MIDVPEIWFSTCDWALSLMAEFRLRCDGRPPEQVPDWAGIENEGLGVPWVARKWFEQLGGNSGRDGPLNFRPTTHAAAVEWRTQCAATGDSVRRYNARLCLPFLVSRTGHQVCFLLADKAEPAVNSLAVFIAFDTPGFDVLGPFVDFLHNCMLDHDPAQFRQSFSWPVEIFE